MATAFIITTTLGGDCSGTPTVASLIHPNTGSGVGRTITAGVWNISVANTNLPANGISVAILAADNSTIATCSLNLPLVDI